MHKTPAPFAAKTEGNIQKLLSFALYEVYGIRATAKDFGKRVTRVKQRKEILGEWLTVEVFYVDYEQPTQRNLFSVGHGILSSGKEMFQYDFIDSKLKKAAKKWKQ